MTPELKQLQKVIGESALRSLRNGGTLRIWRRSSPHNWWVEGKRGRMHWHSGEDGDYPDLRMFRLIRDSEAKVVAYWGSDSGRPEESVYVLKPSGKLDRKAKREDRILKHYRMLFDKHQEVGGPEYMHKRLIRDRNYDLRESNWPPSVRLEDIKPAKAR